jgi:hydroxymethylbilane synthase
MRIGTRGSPLALAQAGHVAEQLASAMGDEDAIELVTITTSGDNASRGDNSDSSDDADPQTPLAGGAPADKSRWVDTIEAALLAGEIDLAVHSAKDVPGELAEGLVLWGAPARVAAEDVLCGAPSLESLPEGARVGTSSVRRAAQLRAAREDLRVVTIGGNVDTRLRRLNEDDLDAIVLARAGLLRLDRAAEIGAVLDPARFVPAPGQGVLALEGRIGDARVEAAVRTIADVDAFVCLRAERAVAHALDASCHTPLGAHATPAGDGLLNLRAWVGLPDGSASVSDQLAETGIRADGACLPASVDGFHDPEALGRRVAERMLAAGAGELLRRAEEMAVEHA